MSSSKLKQDKIYENIDAIRAFLHDCSSVFDNGSTFLFNAQGTYKFKKSNTYEPIPLSEMSFSTNEYGSWVIRIPVLDAEKCFTELNTEYSLFNHEEGSLSITGKDNCGTGKGDYEIVLMA